MTPTEAVALCRIVKAYCPQQQIDEYTADAYGEVLAPFRLEDCREAVTWLGQRQTFISPAEIVERVKSIRAKRISEAPHPIPPPGLSEAEERAWIGDARRRIGDGETLADTRQLVERDLPELRALIQRRPRKPEPAPLLGPGDHSREPEAS